MEAAVGMTPRERERQIEEQTVGGTSRDKW